MANEEDVLTQKIRESTEAIDETLAVLVRQAKAQRRYALLQAAAMILAGEIAAETRDVREGIGDAVDDAVGLLAEIERREEAK